MRVYSITYHVIEMFALILFYCYIISLPGSSTVEPSRQVYYYLLLTFNVARMQSTRDNVCPLRTVFICQTTSSYMAVLFISIDRMPFLVPSLDNADPLFALVINTRLLCAPRRGGRSRPS